MEEDGLLRKNPQEVTSLVHLIVIVIPLQAAKEYDKEALRTRGPGAVVNFPIGQAQPNAADQAANGVQAALAGDEVCDEGSNGQQRSSRYK